MDKLICEYCNKSYCNKSTLKKHQQTTIWCLNIQKQLNFNVSKISFGCSKCPKSFTTKQNLNKHVKSGICHALVSTEYNLTNIDNNKLYLSFKNLINVLSEQITELSKRIDNLETITMNKTYTIKEISEQLNMTCGEILMYKNGYKESGNLICPKKLNIKERKIFTMFLKN